MPRRITTLLLVDDDIDEHELFPIAISGIDNNISVVTATNGVDALERLAQASQLPDLMFVDLNMPQMNGRQLLEKLKQMAEYRHIPVHIYSTSFNPDDKTAATALGAASFITKPDTFQELCRLLREVITSA